MIIREITTADEKPLLKLWNICLTADTLDSFNFYKRIICDINFDPSFFLLAEKEGKIVGFAYGLKRRVADEFVGMQQEQSWLSAMGVHPDFRRMGIGRALLSEVESRLLKKGAKNIDLGTNPQNYFFPGVDQQAYGPAIDFFKACGYTEKSECVSMDMSLRDYTPSEKHKEKRAALEEQGYSFGFYQPKDTIGIFNLLRTHFPHWLDNVRDSILAGRAEKSVVIARNEKSEVVGFAMRGMDGTEERFGPFGVSPDLQVGGIGGVMYHELIQSMIAQRIFYTYFLWTAGRNVDIYGSWGMKIYRKYSMMGRKFE